MGITDTAKWRAIYNEDPDNPEFLSEIDKNGKEHPFKEIDKDRLVAFQIVNAQNVAVCQVRLGEGKRLIFARRNLMTTGRRIIQQGEAKVPVPVKAHQKIIILGWQKTVNGTNVKAIFYLLPDGRIEMDDEWRKDSLHSKVNTPGLIPEEEPKQTFNSLGGKPVSENETKETAYSGSNDSAFKKK